MHITCTEIKMDWSEMDLFGHVNNVAYFKYVQTARVNYLHSVGINTHDADNKLSFAVAQSTCLFKKPLYFPGSVSVHSSSEWIKNTSLQLSHTIFNAAGEVAAEATDVIVLFDYASQCKVAIPAAVREKISRP
jgi:acyl-CoA thioester hydrolase